MNCLQYLGTFKIIINKNNHTWKFVKSTGNIMDFGHCRKVGTLQKDVLYWGFIKIYIYIIFNRELLFSLS